MTAYPAKLMRAGLQLMEKTWQLATSTLAGVIDDQIKMYVPHQVSSHNTRVYIEALDLTASKVKLTFPWLGNTGPVGLPTALAMAGESDEIETGDHVCLMGIGSGLNSTIMSLTW